MLIGRLAMSLVARSLTTLVLAAAISAGMALLPMAPFGAHPAWPHGGGGGGGDGGGNGNGGGHGNGGAGSAMGSGASASAGASVDPSHTGKGSGSKGGKGSAASKGTKGSTASKLGALNAAHASPNALAHASPNSRVGKIAAYKEAINALNAAITPADVLAAQTAAAQALANAANKSINASTVASLDSLLGLSVSPANDAAITSQAQALQTKP